MRCAAGLLQALHKVLQLGRLPKGAIGDGLINSGQVLQDNTSRPQIHMPHL